MMGEILPLRGGVIIRLAASFDAASVRMTRSGLIEGSEAVFPLDRQFQFRDANHRFVAGCLEPAASYFDFASRARFSCQRFSRKPIEQMRMKIGIEIGIVTIRVSWPPDLNEL